MASRSKVRLSKTSRENMKNYPATVERSDYPFFSDEVFHIYCSSNGHRSYLHDSFGFPVHFKSFDAAQRFINTFK